MKLISNYNNTIYNKGENFFYKELTKSEQFPNVYVIHSLQIAEHIKQCSGEIDFLLIGEFGLICIEVKGGTIKRENGNWFVDDRELKKSPFVQASDNIFSLRDSIKEYFQSVNKNFYIPTGYGVAFPFTNFEINSPEWDNSIVYTSMDVQKNIDFYIKRLIHYWTQKQKEKKSNYRPLDKPIIEPTFNRSFY